MSGTSSERISTLWQTRYRTPAPKTLPDNAVLDLLLSHHSVRAYLPDALPEGTLEAGIAAASSAATSSNLQVWSVVAVENPETRARLAELCGNQKHIEVAPCSWPGSSIWPGWSGSPSGQGWGMRRSTIRRRSSWRRSIRGLPPRTP